jgi:hypothetical protein
VLDPAYGSGMRIKAVLYSEKNKKDAAGNSFAPRSATWR